LSPQNTFPSIPVELQQAYPNLVTALGSVLRVDDYNEPKIQRWVRHLAQIPSALHTRLVQAGLTEIHLGNCGVPDLDNLGHLRDITPRGWAAGSSWDQVEGCYDSDTKIIVAGNALGGSNSRILHEYGHAVGDLLGHDHDHELIAAHIRCYSRLSPYYKQGGAGALAGREEMFAESFAEYFIFSRAEIERRYDAQYVTFLEKAVIGAQP